MVRTFMADKMSLTITPEQFAAAKAKLLRGLPASYTHLLSVAAFRVSERGLATKLSRLIGATNLW
jgi:hypothetical protein